MLSSTLTNGLAWVLGVAALTSASLAPLDSRIVDVRHAPGMSQRDTVQAIGRALYATRDAPGNATQSNSTSLSKSFNNARLFHFQSDVKKNDVNITVAADITCTTCYVAGNATVHFIVDGSFNASQALQNITSQFKSDVSNLTDAVVQEFEDDFEADLNAIAHLDFDELDFPTVNASFELDIPQIPACHLSFEFDGLEMYVELDTVLSGEAAYSLNLYTSETALGFELGKDLSLGVIFEVDLILDVNAEIDITSGFHIKLEDGLALKVNMFEKNVSDIIFNGGKFEFLPVTIASAGAVLQATLRMGVHAGFELATPQFSIPGLSLLGDDDGPSASAGIEVGVFAHVAEFTTNITANPNATKDECALAVVQDYRLAVGANAGATLAIGDHTWGPVPNTTVAVFGTTLKSLCAKSRAPATSTVSGAAASTTTATTKHGIRAPVPQATSGDSPSSTVSLITTTISTKIIYTAVGCQTTGLINCPNSLQQTSKATSTVTLVTSVPSGVVATFPPTTSSGVTAVSFGNNVKDMTSSISGTPTSFVPTPTPSGPFGGLGNDIDNFVGGLTDQQKKLILGLSIGLGVPLLVALVAGCVVCCRRRRRFASVPQKDASPPPVFMDTTYGVPKQQQVHVTVVNARG